jgi:hypothetical protein
MISKLSLFITKLLVVILPIVGFSQVNPAPVTGTTSDFLLFTSLGNITNAGTTSTYSGSVGTNAGTLSGFVLLLTPPTNLYSATPETAQCAIDLNILYNDLAARTGTERVGVYGSETLMPGVYTTAGAVSIASDLILDGGGDLNARFIIKTSGAFTMAATSKILLTNGTQAKNVFWVIAGAAAIAANCEVRGMFICHAGAISIGANVTMQGNALTLAGAITTLDGMTLATASPPVISTMVLTASQTIFSGTTPADLVLTGNSSPVIKWQSSTNSNFSTFIDILHFTPRLSGSCTGTLTSTTYYRAVILIDGAPAYSNHIKITTVGLPDLGPLAPFALFTIAGAITNSAGVSVNNALIGTNAGAITGTFSNTSQLHIEDALTLSGANYLLPLFTSIKNTPTTNTHAITFGAGETLVPGVYEVVAAASLSGILTLDAQGSANSIFIIKITAALSMAANSKIILTNGALASNVFWVLDGALVVGASSDLKGTFICLAGAIALGNKCKTEGGIFTIAGAITLRKCTLSVPSTDTMILSANQTLAIGAVPSDLVVTGNSSPVVKWQSATNSAFNNPTDIVRSSTILSGSCIGSLIVTTFYRAVLLTSGVPVYSNSVKISIAAPLALNSQSFALFTTAGNITNAAGTSINNALIGTNAGAIIGAFSNMSLLLTQDAITLAFATNLLTLFNSIKNTPTTNTHAATFVDGETVLPGVYQVDSAATLAGIVTLDGLGFSDSKFIIKITGAFAFTAASQIILTNGALASNVFWVIDGALSAGASCNLKGTFICLAGAIALGNNCTTEGGIFTIAGAITLQNCHLAIPIITATSSQVISSGAQPQNLTLTGNVAAVVRWEKSTNALFTNPVGIANATTTLTGLQIGALTNTTYFRAVATIGNTTINSNSVLIAVNQPAVSVVAGDASATPILFIYAALTTVTHSTSGATGIATPTGLPPGVNAVWASNTISISGTPTALGIFNYSIPLIGSCGNDATGSITVNPLVYSGGTVSPNQSFCSPTTPGDLILSGNSGSVVKWQSALTSDFADATDINSYETTLTSAMIGSLSGTTYFRSVVQSCTEPVRYGAFVTVSIAPPTTWDGVSWSNGYPSLSNAVIFAADFTTTADIESCSLTVNAGASVIVNSGHNITLGADLIIDDLGSFTLNNNANLLQPDGVVNTGIITVKRNSAPLYRLDSTLWSSPVAGQNLKSFSPATLVNRFLFYDPTASVNGAFAPVFNNALFPNPTEAAYTFETAKGYLIRSPNNFATYVPAVLPATVSAVAGVEYQGQFTGTPNNGTINSSISTASNGYNLIGNPYPSAIALADFLATNSNTIDGTIWLWRKINNLSSGIGYATLTNAGLTSIQPDVAEGSSGGKIGIGQGFFVKVTSGLTVANIAFNNAMRSANNSHLFFRNQNTTVSKKHRIWLNLSNATQTIDQMLVGYITDATDGVDYGFEGKTFGNNAISLSSLVDDNPYTIQARSLPFEATDVVYLNFETNSAGTYTISIDRVDGLFETNQDIFLKDNLTGNLHNLKLAAYSFQSQMGNFNTRFEIRYQNQLDVNNPVFDANAVIIYKQEGTIHINSGNFVMNKIEIYDTTGRLLFTKANVNTATENIAGLSVQNQILIIKITTLERGVITKKISY